MGRRRRASGARPAAEFHPAPAGRTSALAGVAVAGVVTVAYAAGLAAPDLLCVPNAMALYVYATAAAAGARLLRGRARAVAAIGLVGTLAVAPFAGWALLAPALVSVASLLLGESVARSFRILAG